MNLASMLQLGRAAQLPAIWSGVLAGMILAGIHIPDGVVVAALLASLSLMFIGGALLNDGFDAQFDKLAKLDRPIARGEIGKSWVFAIGIIAFLAGLALLLGFSKRTLACGGVLAVLILFHGWFHKGNIVAPLILAACHALVMVIAGFALVAKPDPMLAYGAGAVLIYHLGAGIMIDGNRDRGEMAKWPLVLLAIPLLFVIVLSDSLAAMVLLGLFGGFAIFALTYLYGGGQNYRTARSHFTSASILLHASLMAMVSALVPAALALACFLSAWLLWRDDQRTS